MSQSAATRSERQALEVVSPPSRLERVAGSFRDPSGQVFESRGRIYRGVTALGAPNFDAARSQGVLDRLVSEERLVPFEIAPPAVPLSAAFSYVLEHPRLEVISYPYEWSFSLLRDAALFHLELLLDLLEQGFTLSDASAYNVQFKGHRPIFIDHLSIRPYREGEFWSGHRQFCEQFLSPLVLRWALGVAHNAWYRGSIEGIPTADLVRLLPLRRRISWNVLVHLVLHERFQRSAGTAEDVRRRLQGRSLPKAQFRAMLSQLHGWIAGLRPADSGATTWGSYAKNNTYTEGDVAAKRQFVAEFIASTGARSVVDLGCNTGDYAAACLEAGALSVVGFDFDQQALDRAHARAKAERLDFLPLFLDARSPSPDQGWRQKERSGFGRRFQADAVLALAFEHHLAIAHNVPLGETIEFILSLAPVGVIEFVPKSDPTLRSMLALRGDIFPHYDERSFRAELEARATVLRQLTLPEAGRSLFAFSRR